MAIFQSPVGERADLAHDAEAVALLESGRHDVWDELMRRFEAAQKLGIGRNTITHKLLMRVSMRA